MDPNISYQASLMKAEDLFLIGKYEESICLYKEIDSGPSGQALTLLREDVPKLAKGNWKYGPEIVEQMFLLKSNDPNDIRNIVLAYLEECKIDDFRRLRSHLADSDIESLIHLVGKNFMENKNYTNAETLFDELESSSCIKCYQEWSAKMINDKDIPAHIVIRFLGKSCDTTLIQKYAEYQQNKQNKGSYDYAYQCYLMIRKINPSRPHILRERIISLAVSLANSSEKFKDAEGYVEGCMEMIARTAGKENYPSEVLVALANCTIKENKEKVAGYEKALPLLILAKAFDQIRSEAKHILKEFSPDCESLADKYYYELAKLKRG